MKNFPITNSALNWLECILSERFGHKWILSRNKDEIIMKLEGDAKKIVFPSLSNSLTEAHSNQGCSMWDAETEGWRPVLGEPLPAPGFDVLTSPLIEQKNNDFIVNYDILGLAYWMLARVEEIGREDLDMHQRFPASSSHAYKYGYLERPIVDEWMDILGQVIKKQWVSLRIKKHIYEPIVTSDVDEAFEFSGDLKKIFRRVIGDLIKRKSWFKAYENIKNEILVLRGNWTIDSYYRGIDLIMNVCEKKKLKVIFFFITLKTDNCYDIGGGINKRIKKIVNIISMRGHKIGLHPGYNTYNDKSKFKATLKKFVKLLSENELENSNIVSRQHYLRWSTPITQSILNNKAIFKDSTLGYADSVGFRCGTCKEYFMFNAVEQKQTKVKQLPLIVMEGTLLGGEYMNSSIEESFKCINKLIEICKKTEGKFVLLWHNSFLNNKDQIKLYKSVIDSV